MRLSRRRLQGFSSHFFLLKLTVRKKGCFSITALLFYLSLQIRQFCKESLHQLKLKVCPEFVKFDLYGFAFECHCLNSRISRSAGQYLFSTINQQYCQSPLTEHTRAHIHTLGAAELRLSRFSWGKKHCKFQK